MLLGFSWVFYLFCNFPVDVRAVVPISLLSTHLPASPQLPTTKQKELRTPAGRCGLAFETRPIFLEPTESSWVSLTMKIPSNVCSSSKSSNARSQLTQTMEERCCCCISCLRFVKPSLYCISPKTNIPSYLKPWRNQLWSRSTSSNSASPTAQSSRRFARQPRPARPARPAEGSRPCPAPLQHERWHLGPRKD